MAIRELVDADGVRWRVWATTPSRGNVRPQFASGWLTFECASERRRLAPIPGGWVDEDDAALCALLAQATAITREALSLLSGAGEPRSPVLSAETADPAHPGETVRPDSPAEPVPPALVETVARVRALLESVETTWTRDKVD